MVVILLIWITVGFGYYPANLWRSVSSGNLTYTVPPGTSFWLYRILSREGCVLLINNQVFFNSGSSSIAYSFYHPLECSSGTQIKISAGSGLVITFYGYEGTSNPITEEGQTILEPLNHSIKALPVPLTTNTTIAFTVAKRGFVSINIYDETGRLIRNLLDKIMEPGSYKEIWNGKDTEGRTVPSGSYFCIIKNNGTSTTKIIRID